MRPNALSKRMGPSGSVAMRLLLAVAYIRLAATQLKIAQTNILLPRTADAAEMGNPALPALEGFQTQRVDYKTQPSSNTLDYCQGVRSGPCMQLPDDPCQVLDHFGSSNATCQLPAFLGGSIPQADVCGVGTTAPLNVTEGSSLVSVGRLVAFRNTTGHLLLTLVMRRDWLLVLSPSESYTLSGRVKYQDQVVQFDAGLSSQQQEERYSCATASVQLPGLSSPCQYLQASVELELYVQRFFATSPENCDATSTAFRITQTLTLEREQILVSSGSSQQLVGDMLGPAAPAWPAMPPAAPPAMPAGDSDRTPLLSMRLSMDMSAPQARSWLAGLGAAESNTKVEVLGHDLGLLLMFPSLADQADKQAKLGLTGSEGVLTGCDTASFNMLARVVSVLVASRGGALKSLKCHQAPLPKLGFADSQLPLCTPYSGIMYAVVLRTVPTADMAKITAALGLVPGLSCLSSLEQAELRSEVQISLMAPASSSPPADMISQRGGGDTLAAPEESSVSAALLLPGGGGVSVTSAADSSTRTWHILSPVGTMGNTPPAPPAGSVAASPSSGTNNNRDSSNGGGADSQGQTGVGTAAAGCRSCNCSDRLRAAIVGAAVASAAALLSLAALAWVLCRFRHELRSNKQLPRHAGRSRGAMAVMAKTSTGSSQGTSTTTTSNASGSSRLLFLFQNLKANLSPHWAKPQPSLADSHDTSTSSTLRSDVENTVTGSIPTSPPLPYPPPALWNFNSMFTTSNLPAAAAQLLQGPWSTAVLDSLARSSAQTIIIPCPATSSTTPGTPQRPFQRQANGQPAQVLHLLDSALALCGDASGSLYGPASSQVLVPFDRTSQVSVMVPGKHTSEANSSINADHTTFGVITAAPVTHTTDSHSSTRPIADGEPPATTPAELNSSHDPVTENSSTYTPAGATSTNTSTSTSTGTNAPDLATYSSTGTSSTAPTLARSNPPTPTKLSLPIPTQSILPTPTQSKLPFPPPSKLPTPPQSKLLIPTQSNQSHQPTPAPGVPDLGTPSPHPLTGSHQDLLQSPAASMALINASLYATSGKAAKATTLRTTSRPSSRPSTPPKQANSQSSQALSPQGTPGKKSGSRKPIWQLPGTGAVSKKL